MAVVVGVKGGDGVGSRAGKIGLVGGYDGSQGLLPGGIEGGEAGGADERASWRWRHAGGVGGGDAGEHCGQEQQGDDA